MDLSLDRILNELINILFINIIGGILLLFIYITRLASKEIFSPSNKINREVGRAKDLSARRYIYARRLDQAATSQRNAESPY